MGWDWNGGWKIDKVAHTMGAVAFVNVESSGINSGTP
jgi:hypothetical protein